MLNVEMDDGWNSDEEEEEEKKKEEVKQLLSFLLCDSLLPPSGFTIAFTVNGEECALSGPPFFNRGSSRRLSLSS